MNQMHLSEPFQKLDWKFHQKYHLKTIGGLSTALYNQNLEKDEPPTRQYYTIIDLESGADLDFRIQTVLPGDGMQHLAANVSREFSSVFFDSELLSVFESVRNRPKKEGQAEEKRFAQALRVFDHPAFTCEPNTRLEALSFLHEAITGRPVCAPQRGGHDMFDSPAGGRRISDSIFQSSGPASSARAKVCTWGITTSYLGDDRQFGGREVVQIEHGHYYVDGLNKVASVYVLSRSFEEGKKIQARSTYVLETLMDDQDEEFELFMGQDLFNNKKTSRIKSLLLAELDKLFLKEATCKKPQATPSPSAD